MGAVDWCVRPPLPRMGSPACKHIARMGGGSGGGKSAEKVAQQMRSLRLMNAFHHSSSHDKRLLPRRSPSSQRSSARPVELQKLAHPTPRGERGLKFLIGWLRGAARASWEQLESSQGGPPPPPPPLARRAAPRFAPQNLLDFGASGTCLFPPQDE